MQKIFPFIEWLSTYRKEYLKGDLFAGLTVGVMLIPQGMAYAMIAGLPPVYGLYASVVPQIIYAIFGTSRQLSVAPVAMDSLLVAAGVSVLASGGTEAYISYAILLAFFVGAFQLLLGVFRLGFITNLLSKPVITGFTSAAALIIGTSQLNHVLGVDLSKGTQVFETLLEISSKWSEIHWLTSLVGILGVAFIIFVRKINKSIPGSLFAVVLGIVAVYMFQLQENGVSIVKEIPDGMPHFSIPNFSLDKWRELLPLAFTISIVAFMESFSVSKALETKQKNHIVRPNQELLGLGMSNLLGSFFQSYPVTGGFSRSAVNSESGAVTPLASVFSALLVGITLIFLTPLFYYLPHAILASIILVAVGSLINIRYFHRLWRESKIELALMLSTFFATLFFSMVLGIAIGVLLSILILLYKSAYPHIAKLGRVKSHYEFRNIKRFDNLEVWDDLLILRVDAPLTFVNIQYFKDFVTKSITEANHRVKTIVLDAGPINYIDATASEGLKDLMLNLQEKDIDILLSEVVGPVRDALYKNKLMEFFGEDRIFLNLNGAVESVVSNGKKKYTEYAVQHDD
ncbi:MAG: solute carrier family 26 protein [Cyclobacteriaceae bacterium]